MLLTIIVILTVITLSVVVYKQRTVNEQLHNEINTNSESICELESFTYHSESEIKDWIDDTVRNVEYDVENHASKIEDIEYSYISEETAKDFIEESHDKLMKVIKEDYGTVDILFKRVRNITKYLSATASDFQKTLDDSGNPIEYNEDDNAERAVRILQICKDAINNNFPNDDVEDIAITFNGDEYVLSSSILEEEDNNA